LEKVISKYDIQTVTMGKSNKPVLLAFVLMLLGFSYANADTMHDNSSISMPSNNMKNSSSIMTSGNMTSGNMAMTLIEAMSTDGSTKVTIDTTPATPEIGKPFAISMTFMDSKGNTIKHQNYAISAIQDGKSVLTNTTGHTHTGIDNQMTGNLLSANPVDIKVTLNGVGLPGTDPTTWIGPKGDVISFKVVPEFGPVTPIVFAIAILSIILIATKFSLISRLKLASF
jgi:predicted secreted protein with PEFG-CTERM motif